MFCFVVLPHQKLFFNIVRGHFKVFLIFFHFLGFNIFAGFKMFVGISDSWKRDLTVGGHYNPLGWWLVNQQHQLWMVFTKNNWQILHSAPLRQLKAALFYIFAHFKAAELPVKTSLTFYQRETVSDQLPIHTSSKYGARFAFVWSCVGSPGECISPTPWENICLAALVLHYVHLLGCNCNTRLNR